MSYTWAFSPDAPNILDSSISSSSNEGSVEQNQPSNPSRGSRKPKVKFDKKELIYPRRLLREQSDFFVIKGINYTPPNKDGKIIDSFYQTITQRKLRKEETVGTVILPMPAKVTDVSGANWGEGFLNPVQALAVGGFTKTGETINDLASGQGLDVLKGIPGAVGGAFGGVFNKENFSYGAAYATSQALQRANIQIDPNELLARSSGVISNPNGELLFKGPRLRGYSFTYRLVPRNRKEAKVIRQIVRFFKQSMAPSKSGILLDTPYVFFLEYKRKNNGVVKALNKFKPCALTDFNVDNTPGDGWNSYYDEDEDISQPIATTIQMNFTELTPIFRDSYDEFGDRDDVGY